MKSKILGIISLEDYKSPINSVDRRTASKNYHSQQGPGLHASQNLLPSSFSTLDFFMKLLNQMEDENSGLFFRLSLAWGYREGTKVRSYSGS